MLERRREPQSRPDSPSTHLCPGGSVNSPSPGAPFHPGVVARAAPVWRRFNPSSSSTPRNPKPEPPGAERGSNERDSWSRTDGRREGSVGRRGAWQSGGAERRWWTQESPICGTCAPLPSVSWLWVSEIHVCPGSSPSSLPPAAFPISHWNLPPPKESLFPSNASVSWIFGYAVGFTARARAGTRTHTYQRARTRTHIQRHEGSAGGLGGWKGV